MFKKKVELPPRPSLPTASQILSDLENASVDDPVFQDPPKRFSEDPRLDAESFTTAQDFMVSNKQLQVLYLTLSRQKESLEVDYKEMQQLAEEIRQQAVDVLK